MSDLLLDNFKQKIINAGRFLKEPLSGRDIPHDVLMLVPRDVIQKYHILPIKLQDERLCIASDSPSVMTDKVHLEKLIGRKLVIFWADTDNILDALTKFYEITELGRVTGSGPSQADDGPLKTSIISLIWHAVRLNASDIHLLPSASKIYIYFRINGHLEDYSDDYSKIFSPNIAPQIINIIKGMDTSEQANIGNRNMPDSGSFEMSKDGILYDFRIATVPVGGSAGQKLILRILPQKADKARLETLGYSAVDRQMIETALYNNATGLFIMSGPTGSGKSTSLYAQMFYLYDNADGPLNVMTIDDPIEIKVPEFSQVQVRRAASDNIDLSPIKILEAFLRSDPDLILYNEIRSKEDGEVALTASTTGHRLFTTLHASDAVRTLTRFIDLGVSKTTLLSELKLVVAQRLVAKLCPICSRPHMITETERNALEDREFATLAAGMPRERPPKGVYLNCSCNHGYVGRLVIPEIIVFSDKFKEFLMLHEGYASILQYLKAEGFKTMWDKGLAAVAKGEVELAELINVVGSPKIQNLD